MGREPRRSVGWGADREGRLAVLLGTAVASRESQAEDASVREADARADLRQVVQAFRLDAFAETALVASASTLGKAVADRVLDERSCTS